MFLLLGVQDKQDKQALREMWVVQVVQGNNLLGLDKPFVAALGGRAAMEGRQGMVGAVEPVGVVLVSHMLKWRVIIQAKCLGDQVGALAAGPAEVPLFLLVSLVLLVQYFVVLGAEAVLV